MRATGRCSAQERSDVISRCRRLHAREAGGRSREANEEVEAVGMASRRAALSQSAPGPAPCPRPAPPRPPISHLDPGTASFLLPASVSPASGRASSRVPQEFL